MAVSTSAGTIGFWDETPLIIWNSPLVYALSLESLASKINLSILGKKNLKSKVDASFGATTKVGLLPEASNALDSKANGEPLPV